MWTLYLLVDIRKNDGLLNHICIFCNPNVYFENKNHILKLYIILYVYSYCIFIFYISLLLVVNNHTIDRTFIFVNWRRYFLVFKYDYIWEYGISFYTTLYSSFQHSDGVGGGCGGSIGGDDTAYTRIRFDISYYHFESIWKNVCNRRFDDFEFVFIIWMIQYYYYSITQLKSRTFFFFKSSAYYNNNNISIQTIVIRIPSTLSV